MEIDILKGITEPIFYVTNEVGRGIGLEKLLPNYHIICLDDHPLVDILQNSGVNVFCLERALGQKNLLFRSSSVILSHPLVLAYIKEKSKGFRPNILFFKPQKKMEILADQYGFNLLGNPVSLNQRFEEKISFFEFCQKEKIKVPPGETLRIGEAGFIDLAKKYGEKLVVQFGRGWAGNSTFFVQNENDWQKLQKDFGELRVKVTAFIDGITVLNNAVIFQGETLVSSPALQIKANPLLTAMEGGTGGREWPVALTEGQQREIKEITKKVGKTMAEAGHQGFFGLDFLLKKTGEVFLSENNSRLTASVPFFTKLELKANVFPLLGFHLLSFLKQVMGEVEDYQAAAVAGSEIVMRNTAKTKIKVNGLVKTGLYQENWQMKKETYFLETNSKTDFWLQSVAPERIINPEIEMARINTLSPATDKEGNLQEPFLEILTKVKQELHLQEC